MGACGVGLCLVSLIKYNYEHKQAYLSGAWMIPTLCIVYFVCVVVAHVRLPGKRGKGSVDPKYKSLLRGQSV